MQLYRPVGLIELQLIYESRMGAFPPRLPEQPIFYPVLNMAYATQIARDWNTKSNSFAGYVTEFQVEDSYAGQFERQIVGSHIHEELWIPAEQLTEFNQHIIGFIQVKAAYFGPQFQGYYPKHGDWQGCDAIEQLQRLIKLIDKQSVGNAKLIQSYALAIFLHYPFWQQYDSAQINITIEQKKHILATILATWQVEFPEISLLCTPE